MEIQHKLFLVPHQYYCCGSILGWLVLIDDRYDMQLFSPLSGVKFKPPSPMTLPPPHEGFTYFTKWYVDRAVISSDPTPTGLDDSSQTIVLIIYSGASPCLAFCKIGDKTWTPIIASEGRDYMDVINYNKKFYAIYYLGGCDIVNPENQTIIEYALPPSEERYYRHMSIVETKGELFLVARTMTYEDDDVIGGGEGGVVVDNIEDDQVGVAQGPKNSGNNVDLDNDHDNSGDEVKNINVVNHNNENKDCNGGTEDSFKDDTVHDQNADEDNNNGGIGDNFEDNKDENDEGNGGTKDNFEHDIDQSADNYDKVEDREDKYGDGHNDENIAYNVVELDNDVDSHKSVCTCDHQNHATEFEVWRYRTTKFTVYKLEETDGYRKWKKVKNIGANAFFLGYNSSFSLAASKNFGCKQNSIYFTEFQPPLSWMVPMWHDIGIFNLEDGSVESIYPVDSNPIRPPPFWFTPNPGDGEGSSNGEHDNAEQGHDEDNNAMQKIVAELV
ncbi:hypothetical protein IFM89_015599 [Coptis chinensis]|uniref:KIB1-4 beta-propeller domain-containing protein n=1 Tax=Coptis chinensis TaxID=261450 RepID=A0A835I2G7_9MAGN|nr:hypothetical protein IFM89_015599 [Coptis chinensis]